MTFRIETRFCPAYASPALLQEHPELAFQLQPFAPSFCHPHQVELALPPFLHPHHARPSAPPALPTHPIPQYQQYPAHPMAAIALQPHPQPHPQPQPEALPLQISPSQNPQFAKRLEQFFPLNAHQVQFHCEVCDTIGTMERDSRNKVQTSCDHHVPCNECRARLIRQLLRCHGCCEDIIKMYPTCGNQSQCLELSKRLSSGLSTTGCPRCGSKLLKETCGKQCDRRESCEYKAAERTLKSRVAALVLDPALCSGQLGDRPCSHYSTCEVHGCVIRGRASQARCPECKKEGK